MVVSPQSRVTSARSWYLTSFVYPLFLLSTPRPLRHNSRKHIQIFFSIENTVCFPFAPLALSGANFGESLTQAFSFIITQIFDLNLTLSITHTTFDLTRTRVSKTHIHAPCSDPRTCSAFVKVPSSMFHWTVPPFCPFLLCTYIIAYFFALCN